MYELIHLLFSRLPNFISEAGNHSTSVVCKFPVILNDGV